jgi:hypothetical protein
MKNINKLYEFDRPKCEEEFLKGYLLDYSDDWSLINVSHDDFFLNGYSVIKNEHIKRYRILDDYNNFFDRTLKKLGEVPQKPPGIELAHIDEIVKTVNKQFPIFTVHREIFNKEICHIGSLQKITLKTFSLSLIGPDAEYNGEFRLKKEDITRIDFGGKYEKGLWLMASQKTRNKLNNCYNGSGGEPRE